ncbi:MAG: SHOCT domain-containing protein [Thermoleophilia bacterium]|nr:SHOCT domain-containing protein [Thermoleophilia bacterium]
MSALAVVGMGFGVMGLLPILTLAVLAWAVIEVTRSRQAQVTVPVNAPIDPIHRAGQLTEGARPAEHPAAAALAILDDRFARGEIDGEDYRARKQDLLA